MSTKPACGFAAALLILVAILGQHQVNAQPPGESTSSARELDALLQEYAYRAFVRPRTGKVYEAEPPANFSGIKLSVIRLRSGSLRRWGVRKFGEFRIHRGLIVTPYVLRLALVYQNLSNWSSVYFNVPGYTFLTPVVGLLAYEAANLSATNLPELNISASMKPISIKFADRSLVQRGQKGKCVYFSSNGTYQLTDLESGNLCRTNGTGHFSIAVKSKEGKSYVWKIVVGVVAGVLGLILLLLLILLLRWYWRKKKMKDMVNRSEAGVVLGVQRVGDAQLPAASMIRTKPVLESEYTP